MATQVKQRRVTIRNCIIQTEFALVRFEDQNINPKILFVFDDAWDSTLGKT